MTTYLTSDLHFDHRNICKFTDRQLIVDQEHHTEWLIDVWNTTVKNSDRIFHLGDFSFATKYDEIASVVKKLQGQKFFIKGNHDRSKVLEQLKSDNLIQNWYHYEEIKLAGTTACLFHFPIASWHKQNYGSIMLHGHSHGAFTEGKGKILDVGLDSSFNLYGNHKFFTEDNIIEYMKLREKKVADHHKQIKENQ